MLGNDQYVIAVSRYPREVDSERILLKMGIKIFCKTKVCIDFRLNSVYRGVLFSVGKFDYLPASIAI